jgi:hypothetical protein
MRIPAAFERGRDALIRRTNENHKKDDDAGDEEHAANGHDTTMISSRSARISRCANRAARASAEQLGRARLVVPRLRSALTTSDRSSASRLTPPAGSGVFAASAGDGSCASR